MIRTNEDGLWTFEQASQLLQDYLADPSLFPDPYPVFAAVRSVEPVHWCDSGIWLVLGLDEARSLLLDQRISRQRAAVAVFRGLDLRASTINPGLATYLSWFIHLDDPDHARLRSLVSKAFSVRALRVWEEKIEATVNEVITSLKGLQSFDLLRDYAKQIPARVMCDIVGVPRADYALFEKWAAALVDMNISDPSAERSEKPIDAMNEFADYLASVVRQRRNDPEERDDLVSLLLEAEEQGDRLDERELIASLMLLINAGHETTGNLIGNGAYALLTHPAQLKRLQEKPDVMPSAIDEFLRYDNPARSTPRLATEDIAIGDQVIRAGQLIQVHLGAVNHDDRIFRNPETLDVTRSNNTHLGFGFGAHFCIGHHLARLEASYAFHGLVGPLGQIELAGPVTWRNSHVRGLNAIPVRRTP